MREIQTQDELTQVIWDPTKSITEARMLARRWIDRLHYDIEREIAWRQQSERDAEMARMHHETQYAARGGA